MIRVAYHSDTYARTARFGLSRYSHALRNALAAKGTTPIPFSSRSDFGRDEPAWLRDGGFHRLAISRKVLAPAWTWLRAPRVEWLLPPFDLLHSIDVDYRAPTRKPWVVTVHDLGPLAHPEFFSGARPWLLRAYVRLIAARADRIICVSQSTAEEVATFAGVPLGDRLTVIAEGVEPAFFAPPPPDALAASEAIVPADTPFLLFSGSMNPRKNLPRILDAFASVAPGIPHHIVLVGTMGWDAGKLQGRIETLRASGRLHTPGYVSDPVLRALLSRASAYLYLSLYEGFGLPILEAMAAGCPVVTSNISSMPEVAGGAARTVDPQCADAIAQAIRDVATDADLASTLRSQGLRRASAFSWAQAADHTIAVYRSLV